MRLKVGRCLLANLSTELGDLLREYDCKRLVLGSIGRIGIPQEQLNIRQSVLHIPELIHEKGLCSADLVVHVVKLEELALEEEVLAAEDPPVGSEETQTNILLAPDLLITLKKYLGLVTAHCILL